MKVLSAVSCAARFINEPVDVHVEHYANGNLAIQLATVGELSEPMARLTICMTDCRVEDDEVFVKNYAENEGLEAWAKRAKIIQPDALEEVHSGYVIIRKFKLHPEFIEAIAKALPKP